MCAWGGWGGELQRVRVCVCAGRVRACARAQLWFIVHDLAPTATGDTGCAHVHTHNKHASTERGRLRFPVYVCIYVYTHIWIRICIYAYMYICIYVCMYMCMSVYLCICTYAHMHTCVHVCVCVCVCARACARVCARVYTCTHVFLTFIHHY